jgi:hypothetical protein
LALEIETAVIDMASSKFYWVSEIKTMLKLYKVGERLWWYKEGLEWLA